MDNFNIFELLYETYKIDKPIRLIELFAGYGSQALALKYLGANFEHYKICEWAINSIIAYASVHRKELKEYGNDYCSDLTKDQIVSELYSMGVSIDYNQPASLDQLNRMKEDKLRLCFNSIMWSNNLVDISRVKGNDLHIDNVDDYTYLLTYSFPCQDLSLAGKGAGMAKGSGTRSGLLWEFERILTECKNKPQILVMENVTQVHGLGNVEHFREWQLRLEEFGYQSYWEDMTATDYKIPQTRNRTFMVSILGNYNYRFPVKSKLNLRLKDLLENNVDEKYYLSDKMIDYISATGTKNFSNGDSKINREIARPLTTEQNKRGGTTNYIGDDFPEDFDLSKFNRKNKPSFEEVYNHIKSSSFQQNQSRIQEKDVCDTLCARDWKDSKCVIEKGDNNTNLKETLKNVDINDVKDTAYIDAYNKKVITDGNAKTILTGVDYRNQDFILIKNATSKGYLEAEEGDGIDISSRMETHRGTVQKGKAQTITCKGGENGGVVVKEESCIDLEMVGNIYGADSKSQVGRVYNPNGLSPTLDTCTGGNRQTKIIEENESNISSVEKPLKEISQTIKANKVDSDVIYNLRIRKLTPKECGRLMGVKDEDIDFIMENQTNSSGYHLFGDSIVVNCLMAIFSTMLDINWKEKFNEKEWWKNE